MFSKMVVMVGVALLFFLHPLLLIDITILLITIIAAILIARGRIKRIHLLMILNVRLVIVLILIIHILLLLSRRPIWGLLLPIELLLIPEVILSKVGIAHLIERSSIWLIVRLRELQGFHFVYRYSTFAINPFSSYYVLILKRHDSSYTIQVIISNESESSRLLCSLVFENNTVIKSAEFGEVLSELSKVQMVR